MFESKMMEYFGTFCLSAKRSLYLNVEFKKLGVVSQLSVILHFLIFSIVTAAAFVVILGFRGANWLPTIPCKPPNHRVVLVFIILTEIPETYTQEI